MNIVPAHPDRKRNATSQMYLAGHFSRLASQVGVNQLHLALANKRNGFPDYLLITDAPGVKLQDGNAGEAELCQINVIPGLLPESVRPAAAERQDCHAVSALPHPLDFP